MKNYIITFLTICISYGLSWSQHMSTSNYRDLTIPFIELNPSKYNFTYPIDADILDSANFSPPNDGLYLKATYGHRYLSGTSNKTDNHGGFDYWSDIYHNGVQYNDNLKAPIVSMCDGVISQVLHGPDSVLELTGTGRSVRVTCDSLSQAFGGITRIYYRHLDSLGPLAAIADTAAASSIVIKKGELIGYMGESGTTTNVHLHLSSTSVHPIHGNSFLSTARLFDPTLHPGVLKELSEARIELIHDWPDSALFRVSWPFNQTINQFEFINQSDTIIFNKEEAYQTGSAIRDDHNCLPNIDVFAYQFNGKQTAQARYQSEMNNIPAIYPASPNRDINLAQYGYPHVPITLDSVYYVYDFVVKNLDPSHSKNNFKVKLSDVWGYAVEGSFLSVSVEDLLNSDLISIYPNPVTEELKIELQANNLKRFSLYNTLGNLVQKGQIKSSVESIYVGSLPKGIYLLQIESKEHTFNHKVIKL